MKKSMFLLILILAFTFSACTLYIPPDFGDGYRSYRIVLLVDPDDAEVLLNGRFIGLAYEFASPKSPLRLQSNNNELIIKKEGYIEEVVDLRSFDSHKVTIRTVLNVDKTAGRVPGKRPPRPPAKERPEYIPQTVKEKDLTAPPEEEEVMVDAVKVYLDIEPGEASIYLNGKFWGISPGKSPITMRLKPGAYKLEVIKPGFKLYKKNLELKDQKELKLSIKLLMQ